MRANAVVTSRPTLVVLRALGLGDLLTAVPALRALARAFPHHYRILAAPVHLAPLAELSGAVDEVLDAAPLTPFDAVVSHVDVAVNLHGRGPQSHEVLLRMQPHRLIAFEHPAVPESAGMPAWRADEHEIHRWCRMLRESGVPADPDDFEISIPFGDPRTRGAVVVHPGASSESRRWPVERWIALCASLRAQGRRVVLTGSATEFRRARKIAKGARLPLDAVLAGRTGLRELAAVVASASAVVCGDTGIAHLATALRTPSVVLFGPTSPRYWGPPPRPYHHVLWRGRTGDPHATHVDPGLASITVEEVLEALRERGTSATA